MKIIIYILSTLSLVVLLGCGGNQNEKSQQKTKPSPTMSDSKKADESEKAEIKPEEELLPSQKIDLESKGVGPIKSLELKAEIDQQLVAKGIEIYNSKCTACHKPDKMLIGPAPAKILTRRTPEWIMNMILNPDGMVKEDPLAKDLFMQFNGSPMSNQNLTQEEARAVLEYFRTL